MEDSLSLIGREGPGDSKGPIFTSYFFLHPGCYKTQFGMLEKILKDFLWQGSQPKKFNLMAWDKIYQINEAGGLGMCNIRLQTLALGAKLI